MENSALTIVMRYWLESRLNQKAIEKQCNKVDIHITKHIVTSFVRSTDNTLFMFQ